MTPLAYIPSPSRGVLHLGPFPLRAYAVCILLGVVVAVWIGDRRWQQRGGAPGTVADVAVVAVPFGLLGARVYHVVTSPAPYLHEPIRALYVWKGGLGIPGGVLGGVLAGWVVCRRRGIRPGAFVDAIAPGVAVAQAIGRFGNYFNQELFGRPTTLPWGLTVSPGNPDAVPGAVAYHPTFLYESLWDLGVAGAVVWADRRFRLGGGRAFGLYLALYASGRLWIEALRIDQASRFLGIRLNDYVMTVVLVGSLAYVAARRGRPREDPGEVQTPSEIGTSPGRRRGGEPNRVEDLGRRWMSARSGSLAAWAVDGLGLGGHERVLELSCGSGRATRALLDRLPDGAVDALDRSDRLLAVAGRRNREAFDGGRLVFHNPGHGDLPTGDTTYDAVLGVHAAQLFEDPLGSVISTVEVLRPGGRLVLALAYRHNYPDLWRAWMDRCGFKTYAPRELGNVLRQAGLTDVHETGQPGDRWIVVSGVRPGPAPVLIRRDVT